jgi:hypothetical protein
MRRRFRRGREVLRKAELTQCGPPRGELIWFWFGARWALKRKLRDSDYEAQISAAEGLRDAQVRRADSQISREGR